MNLRASVRPLFHVSTVTVSPFFKRRDSETTFLATCPSRSPVPIALVLFTLEFFKLNGHPPWSLVIKCRINADARMGTSTSSPGQAHNAVNTANNHAAGPLLFP